MELRAFANIKAAINRAAHGEDVPTGRFADLVKRVLAERVREQMHRG